MKGKTMDKNYSELTRRISANLTKLRAVAKRLRTQHDLAIDLWATGDMAARLLATLVCRPKAFAEDELDRSLRPRTLAEFVGQDPLKEQLGVSVAAAAGRGEALDHVLLAGPPGLGKTSLAQILAEELGVPFVMTAGPALERKGDVASFLTALEPRSIFFVDEIHRLPRALEETFYPAMEDRQLPITVGQGAGARVVTLDLPAFTLVGATTRAGLLTTPLHNLADVARSLSALQFQARPDTRSVILEVDQLARAMGMRPVLREPDAPGTHPQDPGRARMQGQRLPRFDGPVACGDAALGGLDTTGQREHQFGVHGKFLSVHEAL